MLGDIVDTKEVVEEEVTFSPDRDAVLAVAEALNSLLEEKFTETRALDILVALEGYAEHMRVTLGIASMVMKEGDDEV